MKEIPSRAQARRLAHLFAGDGGVHVSEGYTDASVSVLVNRAWVSETEDGGVYPSGRAYKIWKINAAGLIALENFLREHRLRQIETGSTF
jgi:hypothetical protein